MIEGNDRPAGDVNEDQGTGIGRRARQAYRLWSWLDRIARFLTSKAGVATGTAIGGVGLAGTVAVTASGVLDNPTSPPPPPTRQPVEIATRRLDSTSLVFPVTGFDAASRRVLFDIVVLSKDLAWTRGSERELSYQGSPLEPAEVVPRIFGAELKAAMATSREVIAVGVASIEGAEATEAERAGRRAETAVRWVERIVPPTVALATLNLGQFRAECTAKVAGDTAWQRPLMVISVRDREPGAHVGEALTDALTGKANLPSPACYTRFEMRGHR
jgi:hypothetical protein